MKKRLTRVLSIFLSLVMLISVMPVFEIEALASTFPKGWEKLNWYAYDIYTTDDLDSSSGTMKIAYDKKADKVYVRISRSFVDEALVIKKRCHKTGSKFYWFYGSHQIVKFIKGHDGRALAKYLNTFYVCKWGDEGKKLLKFNNQQVRSPSTKYFKYSPQIEASSKEIAKVNPIKNNSVKNKSSTVTTKKNIIINSSMRYQASLQLINLSDIFGTITAYAADTSIVIPEGTSLVITKLSDDGKKGLITYKGVQYWVDLSYFYYTAPAITKPVAPKVTLKTAKDIAIGEYMTASWNAVVDAKYYSCSFYNSSGKCVKTFDNIYGTSCTWSTSTPDTYTIKVVGKNSVYTGDTGTCATKVVVHGQSDVTYVDEDGTVLSKQKAHYKENVTSPVAPTKVGYTFAGWDKSLNGITGDTVLTAKYKINQYRVQFKDYYGNLVGEEQLVEYGKDAVVPESANAPKNYKFIGWDSEKYLNVYSYDVSKPIVINALYEWVNKDLPVDCEMKSADRYSEGYELHFSLKNYPNDVTIGRAIIALKTAEGKLITTTESAAFRLNKDEAKQDMYVFVPCQEAASVAEIMIVDSYSSGIPISEKSITNKIDNSKRWSNWLTEEEYHNLISSGKIIDGETTVESEKQFRYIDAKRTTYNSNVYGDWTYDGTYSSSVGAWTAYQDKAISAVKFVVGNSYSREVETKQVEYVASKTTYYNYHHYYNPSTKRWSPTQLSGFTGHHTISLTYQLSYKSASSVSGYSYYGSYACPTCSAQNMWVPNGTTVKNNTAKKTQYRSRDTKYTYNFYRFDYDNDWTEWTDAEPTVTDPTHRKVDSRTVYRYQSNTGVDEDTSGELRTFDGSIVPEDEEDKSKYANKNVTMIISKYDESSDFTNEFVGQTVTDANGNYSFTFKLREEPTPKTGDFSVYVGVEGRTCMEQVGTIEYSREDVTFDVEYQDYDGNIISTQKVKQGETAVVPDVVPERKGYTFVSWNTPPTNVQKDLTGVEAIKPIYVKNKFVVIYVNWNNQTVTSKEYEYGDVLEAVKFNGKTQNDVEINDEDFVAPFEEYVEDEEEFAEESQLASLDAEEKADDEIDEYESETGYAVGWDAMIGLEDEDVLVTEDMVVSAVYEPKTYKVDFYDYDGNIVDSQTVEYDGAVEAPELPTDDGVIYDEWDIDVEDLYNIRGDLAVFPMFEFEETTPTPVASVKSGAYANRQLVSLSCEDENAVIYYTLNGEDSTESDTAIEYTEPFYVDQSSTLNYYAVSFNKNDSEAVAEYYAIGSTDKIVTIHNSLDEDITLIVPSMADINLEDFDVVDGYTFDGLFSDEACTQKMTTNDGAYGQVVELYAKYTIKEYQIRFFDSEDAIAPIKTESVQYSESATPPEMMDKNGLVFTGWSTDDYYYAYKDIDVYAIYKRPEDAVKITLDKTNYALDQGAEFQINATVNKDDVELVWDTSNDDVAIVDDGTVVAVGTGEATITVSDVGETTYAQCKVTVNKSINTSICLNNLSSLKFDSQNYLRRLPIDGTNTVEFITSQFNNNADSLKFVDINGRALTSSSFVGTGTVISLINGDETVDSVTAVLTGDVTGDGKIDNKDVSYIARYLIRKQRPNATQLVATDVNGDGRVNNIDAAMLSRYLVGKDTIKSAD